MEEQKKILLKQVMSDLENGNWIKELEEGFLSIPQIWNEVTASIESKDIDTDILKDFYDKDPIIIQEIKKTLLNSLKREIWGSIDKNIALIDENNDVV